jgi:hypothetical protein
MNIKLPKVVLKCEICHLKFNVTYNIPKVLSCGHTICSKCVDRLRERNFSKCPFDRKILDLDEEKISINYYVLSLIDNTIVENSPVHMITEEEEEFQINPQPVVNSPGWKNTLDGFIKDDILYSVESNGFIYCTDLNTGEWWFMYHNQFFGNFFFRNPSDNKMYLIDQYGSLFQIFNKNYYTQIGRKSGWRNTTHLTVFNNKIFTLESSNKCYETNLSTGKWKEIAIVKSKNKKRVGNFFSKSHGNNFNQPHLSGSNGGFPYALDDIDEVENQIFKNVNMIFSNSKSIMFSNKNGELYSFDEILGEAKKITNEFKKNIESYYATNNYVYYFEKNSKKIFRFYIEEDNRSNAGVIKENHVNSDIINPNGHNKDEMFTSSKISKHEINEEQEKLTQNHLDKEYKSMINDDNKPSFLESEMFLNLESIKLQNGNVVTIDPLKLIGNDDKLCIIDKLGDLYVVNIKEKTVSTFQCLFMLRNCHMSNTALIGDGDLLLLDPIRLSLNKLNIIAGTEVIILHSTKFLYSIKQIFSALGRIYIIDTSGNIYFFNESDKKLTQIGNNAICKYIVDFAVHKNYLLTIENSSLYKTNLSDGNYSEIKLDECKSYEHFFSDNNSIIFINKDDLIFVYSFNILPKGKVKNNSKDDAKSQMVLKKSFRYENITKMHPITFFRNFVIFYNKTTRTIESINVEDKTHKKLAENFPEILMFINNSDILACILRDGVIYKLYC